MKRLLNTNKGLAMPKIFISHACEDNEISRKLAKQLRLDGAEVWIYYAAIEVGDRLPQASKVAVEWCDIFIMLWSKSSANSDVVKMECRRALVLKKKIMLCRLDATEQTLGLPRSLNVNFYNFDKGYINLAQLLNLEIKESIQDSQEKNEPITKPKFAVLRLRAEPAKLSEAEVAAMITKHDFFDLKRNENSRGLNRKLEMQDISGDKVIADPTAGLMWQSGGNPNSLWYDETKSWISELNQQGYAGYKDWRLPTLEEAMSLIKNASERYGLYIEPIFDNKQSGIWTADLNENASRAWVVFFNYGSCYVNCFDFKNFARAVRSENKPA